MNSVVSALQTALPVFLALALGMLCRQKKFLSRDGIDALKKVVSAKRANLLDLNIKALEAGYNYQD